MLFQAFLAVENVYFESTDGLLAEKTTTQDRLPDVGFLIIIDIYIYFSRHQLSALSLSLSFSVSML